MSTEQLRVMIVDPHEAIRLGVRIYLSTQADFDTSGWTEMGGAAEALTTLSYMEDNLPHVLITELSLPLGSWFHLIGSMAKKYGHKLPVLVYSAFREQDYALRTFRAGARGYVRKTATLASLGEAIRAVVQGKPVFSEKILQQIFTGQRPEGDSPLGSRLETLTDRESEVFDLLGEGYTLRQIAAHLKLSPKTVESHREKLKQKLGCDNSVQLQRWACEHVLRNSDLVV